MKLNARLSMGVFCCLFVEYLSIVQGGIFIMSGKKYRERMEYAG